MASSSGLPTPRRSKTMPTEGHMTKFLYSILKQLDLKPIDWSQVATDLEISNGHAARMRYSRFKQQMEGTVSVPRIAKPKKTAAGKGDTAKGDSSSSKGAKLGKGGAPDKEKRSGGSTTPSSENVSMEAPPAYSKKRRTSEALTRSEPTDFNTKRQQMAESSMLSTTSSFPHGMSTNNNRMVPNGMMMMMPFSNTNSSNPYALPLRSPTQMAMYQDDVMMNHQPSSYPYHYHHQHPYGSINADYTTDSFVNTPQSWHHPEYCFSGCCQPPPYPATPSMYPSYPATTATTLSTSSSSTPFPWQQQQHQQIHPQLLQQPHNVWVPVKQEGGGEGVSDELLVKVETGGESEMRVDE